MYQFQHSHSKSGEDPLRINSGSQRLSNCNVSINNPNTNSGFCSDSSSSVLCILSSLQIIGWDPTFVYTYI